MSKEGHVWPVLLFMDCIIITTLTFAKSDIRRISEELLLTS